MSETPGAKKRGRKEGYRKPDAMKGRLNMRVPLELVDWLEEEGAKYALGVQDMARMIMMKEMRRKKSGGGDAGDSED